MSDIKNIINNILNDREPLNEYDAEDVNRASKKTKESNINLINTQIDELELRLREAKNKKTEMMKAEMMKEDHMPGEDEEYDYEGSMAKTQLCQIHQAATKMMKEIEDNENLPEWVQSKIAVACDYMIKIASYLDANDEHHDDKKEMEAMQPAPASEPHMGMPKRITPFEPKPINLGRKMMGFSIGDPQPSSGGDF